MAKANLKSAKVTKKQKTKKSGKGKWVLLFFILILILLGAAFYYWLGNPITMFFSENDLTDEPQYEVMTEMEQITPIIQAAEEVIEVETEPVKPEKPKPKKPTWRKYYIKVDDCLAVTCQQEVIRFLKQEKLPYLKKKYSRKTKYYELVSTSIYTQQIAKEKIGLMKMQKEIIGEPYLIREKKRYRISMGFFPQKETGIRMKAELVHLYPKLKVEFDIRPKDRHYTVTSIFAGPFRKNTAKKVLQRVHDHPQYETSSITMKL